MTFMAYVAFMVYGVTALPQAMPMAKCVPTNNVLVGPLNSVIDKITGAFGGLIAPLGFMMILLVAALVVVTILTKRAQGLMKAIGMVVGVLLGLPLVVLVVSALYTLLNNACTSSPF